MQDSKEIPCTKDAGDHQQKQAVIVTSGGSGGAAKTPSTNPNEVAVDEVSFCFLAYALCHSEKYSYGI